jgi:hypothetical protein
VNFMNEKELCDFIENKLIESGFKVNREVPFYLNSVDIVAIRKRKIIAIEVKLKNYQKALVQARNHCLFAHEVYIALPEVIANKIDINRLNGIGIGIVSVGNNIRYRLKSKSRIKPIDNYIKEMIEYCESN